MAIEHIEEQPTHGNVCRLCPERLHSVREKVDDSTCKAVGCEREVDELLSQIDGDTVEADDRKKESPSAPFQHIYQVIEECKQEK